MITRGARVQEGMQKRPSRLQHMEHDATDDVITSNTSDWFT